MRRILGAAQISRSIASSLVAIALRTGASFYDRFSLAQPLKAIALYRRLPKSSDRKSRKAILAKSLRSPQIVAIESKNYLETVIALRTDASTSIELSQ